MTKAIRLSEHVYRLVQGATVVGFALLKSSGGWVMADLTGRPLVSTRFFDAPSQVARAWDARFPLDNRSMALARSRHRVQHVSNRPKPD